MKEPIIHDKLYSSKFKFIVLGAGRSGTSLLAGMIDQHPTIEMEFYKFANEYLRGQALDDNQATLFYDRTRFFVASCICVANQSSKPMWGNKITTEQVEGLNEHNLYNSPSIDILNGFFNDVLYTLKIVYILRDGRACIQSKLKRTDQSLERACESWKYAVSVYGFLRHRPHTHCIRFETLVTNPINTLKGVLSFLGVDYDPCVLKGTMSPKMMEIYRRPIVDASRAWDFDHDHPCVASIAEALEICGYR